jgi:hypothetical protein
MGDGRNPAGAIAAGRRRDRRDNTVRGRIRRAVTGLRNRLRGGRR